MKKIKRIKPSKKYFFQGDLYFSISNFQDRMFFMIRILKNGIIMEDYVKTLKKCVYLSILFYY